MDGNGPCEKRNRSGWPLSPHRESLRRRTLPISKHRLAQPDAHWNRVGETHGRLDHHTASFCGRSWVHGAFRWPDLVTGGCRQFIISPGALILAGSYSARCVGRSSWDRPGHAVAYAAVACTLPIATGMDDDGADDNSGVFVAFPDPEQQNYDNTAYVGINLGFEVQIDELGRPDNALSIALARSTLSRDRPMGR